MTIRPSYVIAALLAIVTATAIAVTRANREASKRTGKCELCGYDLRGLGAETVCPECGKKTADGGDAVPGRPSPGKTALMWAVLVVLVYPAPVVIALGVIGSDRFALRPLTGFSVYEWLWERLPYAWYDSWVCTVGLFLIIVCHTLVMGRFVRRRIAPRIGIKPFAMTIFLLGEASVVAGGLAAIILAYPLLTGG